MKKSELTKRYKNVKFRQKWDGDPWEETIYHDISFNWILQCYGCNECRGYEITVVDDEGNQIPDTPEIKQYRFI